MKSRKIHKIAGLILMLPMLGWTLTGLVFILQPGYSGAYDRIKLKTYPLEQSFSLPSSTAWKEARLIKTILGNHLLVKTDAGNEHLDPATLLPKKTPSRAEYEALLEDAFLANKERYGEIMNITGQKSQTSTGIDVNLDWTNLTLSQQGKDTKIIKLLYKIHYLQWTPFKILNRILAVAGLFLLIVVTVMGMKIYIKNRK